MTRTDSDVELPALYHAPTAMNPPTLLCLIGRISQTHHAMLMAVVAYSEQLSPQFCNKVDIVDNNTDRFP